MKDPIVDEVRQTRERLVEKYGPVLEGWIAELKASQAKYGDRLVSRGRIHGKERVSAMPIVADLAK